MFSKKLSSKLVRAAVNKNIANIANMANITQVQDNDDINQNIPSTIGSDLVLSGNVVSGGEVQVQGVIEGDVRASSVIIGPKATVNGEIVAEEVTVRGRVVGQIRGVQVMLAMGSHVEGNIIHQALTVEKGAFFDGQSCNSDNPLNNPKKASKIKQKSINEVERQIEKIQQTDFDRIDEKTHTYIEQYQQVENDESENQNHQKNYSLDNNTGKYQNVTIKDEKNGNRGRQFTATSSK